MKLMQGVPHYRYDELIRMETLAQGQADDLKVEIEREHGRNLRIWLSRAGIADGEPFRHTVTIEKFDPKSGRWEQLYRYDGDHPMTIKEN